MPEPQAQPTKIPWPLTLTFVLLATAVGMGGYVYYLGQERSLVAEHQGELLAVADLKVSQLVHWRRERMGDAQLLSDDTDLARELEAYLTRPSDPALAARTRRRLSLFRGQDDYVDVVFCDADGSVRMAAAPSPPKGLDCAELTSQAARLGSVFLSDFSRQAEGNARLFLAAPIAGLRSKVLGAIVLVVDPGLDLYDLVQAWPTSSPTTESLLVEGRGQDVVFLSHLRHRANEPLLFSLPLTRTDLPAAQAVMGREGVVSGADYRGVPVLGAVRRVPETPWYVVAKIDRSEVQAPLRARALGMILVSTLLILCAGTAVILFWRQQQVRFYRQQYEAELQHRALAGRFDHLSRYANDIILLFDESGDIVEANERAVSSYGFPREELLKLNIRDLREPSTMEQLAGQWETVRKAGSIVFETLHRRGDGSIFPVEVSSRSLESEGRHFVQSVIRDVSERKKAEAELRRVNRALRMLTNCDEALIRATDENRLFGELCRVAVEVGGYTLAWVGIAGHDQRKSVRLVAKAGFDQGYLENSGVTWADEPQGRTPMGTAIRTGRPFITRGMEDIEHVPYLHFAESHGIAAGAGLPLRVEGGVIGALAVYSGETDSFDSAEMAILNELAEDLSFGIQTIRRRAAQTAAEEALRQSQKLESIGRLAGGLAHDFNNYLTVINGYCEVLLDSLPPDDPTREQVYEIRKSGGRATELTGRLLAFSRGQVLDPKPCSLNEIVRELENMLRRAVGSGVELDLEFGPGLWLIMADPVQIQQVLINLVINARDAMPSGGKVGIRTSNVKLDHGALPLGMAMGPGDYVVLTVWDAGIGMDEETRSHLFEPFFTSKAPGQGTGLGLSTVYGIVRQSGGWISVHSEPGQGATFQIHFPRRVP